MERTVGYPAGFSWILTDSQRQLLEFLASTNSDIRSSGAGHPPVLKGSGKEVAEDKTWIPRCPELQGFGHNQSHGCFTKWFGGWFDHLPIFCQKDHFGGWSNPFADGHNTITSLSLLSARCKTKRDTNHIHAVFVWLKHHIIYNASHIYSKYQ